MTRSLRIIMKIRKISSIVVAFALMALLARPQLAFAQVTTDPTIGSWERLKAIPPGDKVEVDLRNGQTLKGKLISVSDTVLTIERGKGPTNVIRGDGLRVFRMTSKSAKRATLIGLGTGIGIGLAGTAIFANTGGRGGEADLYGLVAVVAGASAGTLIGYIVGRQSSKRNKRVLIYETK
jgi:hypothetical protein